MSAASKPPVAVVGVVKVLAPNAKGYYRLKWDEPDGTPGDTSAGRILEDALLKATEIDTRVRSAAGPRATSTLAQVRDHYFRDGHSPYKGKKPWKGTNRNQIEHNLTRCLRTFEDYRAMDVDRALCDRMRAQAGTEQMVRINTTALRAFLVWGEQNGYFTALQAELLPRACSMPAPRLRRTATRIDDDLDDPGQRARMNGQSERYIRDEDAPSRERVVSLRTVLGRELPLWGELAPELAANTGARWGEQFQLTAHDAHLDGCTEYEAAHMHVEWQVDGAADKTARRTRPKGDKTRVIPIPSVSFTGYRLRDSVRDRVAAALEEQGAGTNPEALLFPAVQGGMLWYSSFNSDALLPAMMCAGWPVTAWIEEGSRWDDKAGQFVRIRTTRRKAELPWHTLRHRFARICVDIKRMPEGELMAIGGWENIGTVQARYYRSGRDNMDRGPGYFD